MTPRSLAAVVCAGLLVAAACSDGRGGSGSGAAPTREGGGSITVLAAASLTDAFTALAGDFEDAHPGTDVTLAFGASSSLREQVLAGAPADVFASADTADMDLLVEAGAAAAPVDVAVNGLQIAVPAGNPAGVDGLDDLADDDLLVGLCAPEAPCGRLARRALDLAGVTPATDTEAPDVRSLLTQIGSGDLDAGIVYRTDVAAAGDAVEGIDIPEQHDVVVAYPIAVLAEAAEPSVARAFVAHVRSPAGRRVLAEHGFGAP